MLSSTRLKEIVSEARPIIERQLDDAERIAGFRDMVSANGGDWSALKALIKAQIQDDRDDAGDGRRVRKILEKAEYSTDYAELLGWSNMNEQNFSSEVDHDPETGEIPPVDESAGISEEINQKPSEDGRLDASTTQKEIIEPQRSLAAQSRPAADDDRPFQSEVGSALDGQGSDESPVNHSPETATKSLANGPCEAVSERTAIQVAPKGAAEAGIDGQPSLTPATTDRTVGANVSGADCAGAKAGRDPQLNSPGTADRGAGPETAPASDDGVAPPVASSSTVIPLHQAETSEQRIKRLRPHCQNPTACAGAGRDHCHGCKRAITSMDGGSAA